MLEILFQFARAYLIAPIRGPVSVSKLTMIEDKIYKLRSFHYKHFQTGLSMLFNIGIRLVLNRYFPRNAVEESGCNGMVRNVHRGCRG